MPRIKPIGDNGIVTFYCPGCNSRHLIQHGEGSGPRWCFNGDADYPTFMPSVLVQYNGPDAGVNGAPPAVCHSYVTDGRIQFLTDSTHHLAGKTVELPELD